MRQEIKAYLAQRRAEGIAATTRQGYTYRLQCLAAFLRRQGVARWRDVKAAHLSAFTEDLKRRRFKFRSRQAVVATVRGFFNWQADHGKTLSNPAHYLTLSDSREDLAVLEPPLSESEVAEMFAALPRHDAVDLRNLAHLELLYSAGLRLSESLALNVRDVDLSNHVVHVRRGKGGKARDIPIVRGLHAALTAYLRVRRSLLRGADDDALLLSQYGGRLRAQSLGKVIQRLSLRLGGRRVHPHLLRHSIAVHLLRGGADIRYVQAFLGHELLDTTKIYLRLVPADIRDAYLNAMPEFAVTLPDP